MYLLVLFFPILGAFISGIFGRFIGRTGSIIITTTCLFFSFLISLFIFFEVGLSNSICVIKLGN
jgi:NADH:ubiquinone oxidoreductase subunit 5 (subunit L)/multisubunit Na+/H+ antiporter MnhA subunit